MGERRLGGVFRLRNSYGEVVMRSWAQQNTRDMALVQEEDLRCS